MTFLSFPFVLGGLLAAVIPVLLHLLMRGVPKRIEFPALRLIQVRLAVTKRNFRLKQLLLLLLRIFVFVLLGLLLARPSLKWNDWFVSAAAGRTEANKQDARRQGGLTGHLAASLGTQEAPVAAAVVLDTSPRMEYRIANKSRLEAAREFAQWVIRQLPKNSRIAILGGHREAAAFQIDPLAAAQRLDRIVVENSGRHVVESVLEAARLLQHAEQEQREIYVFTDLTRPGWTGHATDALRELLDELKKKSPGDFGVYLIDLGAEKPCDTGIKRVVLSEQTIAVRSPVHLDVELRHEGEAEERILELCLQEDRVNATLGQEAVDGQELQRRGSQTLVFAEGSSEQRLRFSLAGLESGTHQGMLRLLGADHLALDNEYYFTLDVRPSLKLLVAAPEPTSRHAGYLREILDPALLKRQAGEGPYSLEIIPREKIDGMTVNDLSGYHAVFLLDPAPLKPNTWKMLCDYTARGRGVGVFLGHGATELESFTHPAAVELLGGRLVRQVRTSETLWIAPDDYLSPVFSAFRMLNITDPPWKDLPILRYWEMHDLTERTVVAAPFSDGRPAILLQPIGRGTVVTMTTPISDPPNASLGRKEWNYLTALNDGSWTLLVLLDGITRTLVGTGERQYNFLAGQAAVIRPVNEKLPPTCLLRLPDGQSLRLTPNTAERTIRYPATEQIGQYRIRSGGAQDALDTGFSVNLPAETLNMQRVDSAALEEVLGPENYRIVRRVEEIELHIARRRVGQELYAPILLLLCCCFIGEYLFSNYFYGKRENEREVAA